MASQVAWLSFDAEQQRRTMLMMAALEEQGTVDQLGLGIVRDQIADALHPGMSVLHTRARYLIFLPRIYQSLTKTQTDAVIAEGRWAEARLARDLITHYREQGGDDHGIIGRVRGEETKQTASYAYWSQLRRLGIVLIPGSLADYCRYRAEVNDSRRARTLLHSGDDVDLVADDAWVELPDEDLDMPVSFDLPEHEAEWLRERFLRSELRTAETRSAVAWLLEPDRHEWIEVVPLIWDHPRLPEFPSGTADVARMGRDLDRLVHGARVLYNWLCARGVPPGDHQDLLLERYRSSMVDWQQEIAHLGMPSTAWLGDLNAWMWRRLSDGAASLAARTRWTLTYRFIDNWRSIATTEANLLESKGAQDLIRRRENMLKPGRA